MDAKDFLRQLKKLDCMIENKLVERQQWKSVAMCTTSHIGGERVQTSSSQQKMADAVGRYMDIEREVDKCIDRLVDTKKDIISVIEQLETQEYDVLHKVYVQYYTLKEVASMVGKTYSNVTTIHGIGLKNVNKILEEREKSDYGESA